MHLHESILHFHEEPINLDPNARNIANIILANTHKPFSLLQAGLHNGELKATVPDTHAVQPNSGLR